MPPTVLIPTPPFDLDATARHQTYYQREMGADSYHDETYYRALEVEGRHLLALVRSTGTVEAPRVTVELKGAQLPTESVATVTHSISRILGLDLDLRPFYVVAGDDPFLSKAVQTFYGLHPTRTASVFEALVTAITGQQISGSVARAIRARVVRTLGTSILVDIDTFYTFPKATDFLEAGQDKLRSFGLSARKAEYILEVASRAADGTLDLQRLEKLSNNDVVEELVQIRGIGQWTAQWTLLSALGRSDAFPSGDLALKRVISEYYFDGEPITDDETTAFASERWGNYAGLATTYLFAYIRHNRASRGQPE